MAGGKGAPVVFIDTETDGVHPQRRVWEVAMLRREDGFADIELSFYVEIDLSTADLFGLQIGRFYERHPVGRWLSGQETDKDLPEPEEATEYVSTREAAYWVARLTHGAHLIGAVPNFDAEVLARLLRFWELTPAWHYHLIDIESMAVGYIVGHHGTRDQAEAEAVALPWSSDELSRACGVEPPGDDERHTALGDARWAARLYDEITSRGAP